MNDYTRDLVACICRNSKPEDVLFYTKKLLDAEKSAKDADFKRRMLEKIEHTGDKINVPANCAMFTIAEKYPNINIDRYYLSDREKEVFNKVCVSHKVAKILADKGIKGKNSIIFYGESGNGKTTLGRYIAYKLELPFIYLKLSYLTDSLLGKTQQNLSNVFRFINGLKCVFMLDEIDAIAAKRGQSNDVSEIGRITISLMQELDELSSETILIGATNRIDIIDDAVLSRFVEKHELKRFTQDERESYVTTYLNDVEIPYTEEDVKRICEESVTQRALENKVIDFISAYFYEDVVNNWEVERKEEE